MKHLQSKAERILDRYLDALRHALRACPTVERFEIERDVREHIEMAVDEVREPVTATAMTAILDRLGSPAQFLSGSCQSEDQSQPEAAIRDDWLLAYLSLALVMLAFALPLFWWVGLLGAFVTARASLCMSRRLDAPARCGQTWLRSPALLVVYVPAILALLLWPAIAVRMFADEVLVNHWLAAKLPWEFYYYAHRIAALRLSAFDFTDTAREALRTGHYLIAPVGMWLIALGVAARAWPGPMTFVFRPLINRDSSNRVSRSLLIGGFLLCLWAGVQVAAKLTS